MKDNPFMLSCHHYATKEWENIPIFRCLLPFNKPNWIIKHEDLYNLCIWIELNIYSYIDEITFPEETMIDYQTVGVLLRIATGMLFKCNLSKDLKIELNNNIIRNINAAYAMQLSNELPFQGVGHWFDPHSPNGYCAHYASDTLINS